MKSDNEVETRKAPERKIPDKELPSGIKKIVAASMAGTVAEWYEFFIYGTAATLVFSVLFFPQTDNPLDGIIAAFATYAVGFLARPIGGLVFGYFGDRVGRKKLLQFSLLLVGVSTFLMGCIPSFDAVGYWAPALLVTLRFIQGFAVGGEWGGAILLVGEHSPNGQRGYWSSFPQAAACVGNVLASVVLLGLSASMPEEAFQSWGWRVAFWLSAFIVLIGYYIRRTVEDAPIFLESVAKQKELETKAAGLREVLTQYPKQVFVGMAARFGENTVYYAIIVFSITYLKVHVGMSTSDVLLIMFLANIVQFFAMIFAGKLSDMLGRRQTYLLGVVGLLIWVFVYFPMLNTGSFWTVFAAIVIGLSLQALCYGPQGALMAELFPTRMRYTGVSFCYQVTSILAGSIAPLICTALLATFSSTMPIVAYLFTAMLLSGVALYFYKETRGISLYEVDVKDEQKMLSHANASK
ncbi:MFS transporter [Cryobacterium sp. Hh7]|uniref:MFS transporter n=1 Tax=unclassified Cryobacterium TaxID=2649013 RepID=UPI00106945EF|nr:MULTISPECIES: MFS transporter [unclassified Cryobacterium]TFD49932.1 MFS transporter [Cryobacterium sp. Hh11]TFD59327.1 MFS transporter [Cryobacterium sp. Hh7]